MEEKRKKRYDVVIVSAIRPMHTKSLSPISVKYILNVYTYHFVVAWMMCNKNNKTKWSKKWTKKKTKRKINWRNKKEKEKKLCESIPLMVHDFRYHFCFLFFSFSLCSFYKCNVHNVFNVFESFTMRLVNLYRIFLCVWHFLVCEWDSRKNKERRKQKKNIKKQQSMERER